MRYAAYGSNLHPLRLTLRTPSARLLATRFVSNRSLCFHKRSADGSAKCNIANGGEGIYVAIFEISAADKTRLDSIEGLGAGYSETTLAIPGLGDCFAYVAEPSHIDVSLAPYDWYKALVMAGACFHGFPDSYIDGIRALPAAEDPDATRRSKRWETVKTVLADAAQCRKPGRRFAAVPDDRS